MLPLLTFPLSLLRSAHPWRQTTSPHISQIFLAALSSSCCRATVGCLDDGCFFKPLQAHKQQDNQLIMAKNKRKLATLHSFFEKRGRTDVPELINLVDAPPLVDEQEQVGVQETPISTPPPQVLRGRGNDDSAVLVVERDPGLRCQISDYPPNDQEKARMAYIKHGAYHFKMDEYPPDDSVTHPRKFQYHWFKSFPWLEYSPDKDAVYCFPCFLFYKKPLGKKGSDVFTVQGFKKWKRVNDGKRCAFLTHMGKDSKSAHNYAAKCYDNLKNKPCHIEQSVVKQTEGDIKRNRLRLRVTVDSLRWLAFQACPFRGHDESLDSKNQGNFLEMVKLIASYDEEIGAVVLGNAPGNAKYTSPTIQKELLGIIASNVQSEIRKEIGDAKFCLLVDESRDESKREQMEIVIRFVDKPGFTRERFLDIVHVADTSSATLKEEISFVVVLVDLFIAKNTNCFLMNRLIRLVLTLPVSTATTERAFSAMKLVKTRLRNKMEDGFLRDCLLIYIEKEIAVGISTDAIIDEFDEPPRRVAFS